MQTEERKAEEELGIVARWQLVLGQCEGEKPSQVPEELQELGEALDVLYPAADEDADPDQPGGSNASFPVVVDALQHLRRFTNQHVYKIIQKDAIERVGLEKLLASEELTENLEPSVELVETIMAMRGALSGKSLQNARVLISRIVAQLLKRLQNPFMQTVRGAMRHGEMTNHPRLRDINWHRTIRLNLKHYQPALARIIPERVVGAQRRGQMLHHVILCVDQSASMAGSVLYSGLYASVMAQMPSLKTNLVLFDTAIVDLTDKLDDPVELLLQVQLGGGTDIAGALSYVERLVLEPAKTLMILVSDLREGGNPDRFIQRCANLQSSGVRVVVLLALSNEGEPGYSPQAARSLANLGIPCFACTPEEFPELLARAIRRL